MGEQSRTSAVRRTSVVAMAVVIGAGVLLGACGGKSSSSPTTTTTQAATSTTVKASSTTSTAATGATTTTLVPTPPPATQNPWSVGPNDIGGAIGKRYSYVCPANGETSYSLWGTGPFTDDSSICVAATYAGLITAAKGGTVTFEVQTGSDSYKSGVANGITAVEYGPWSQQFVFVK